MAYICHMIVFARDQIVTQSFSIFWCGGGGGATSALYGWAPLYKRSKLRSTAVCCIIGLLSSGSGVRESRDRKFYFPTDPDTVQRNSTSFNINPLILEGVHSYLLKTDDNPLETKEYLSSQLMH
jgi:hypothetical protein